MSGEQLLAAIAELPARRRVGRVSRVSTSYIEAHGPPCRLGDVCEIEQGPGRSVFGEVVAIQTGRVVLVPLEEVAGLTIGARVMARAGASMLPVGEAFKGRAIDGMGRALDDDSTPLHDQRWPIDGRTPSPLDRTDAQHLLATGVRAIDAFSPIGKGQRLGIFAASGVGKTTLMRQLARQIACDHCIICLIGERGREVEDAWRELSTHDRTRFTLVAATSDTSAPLRVRAAQQALCLAEHWRARGAHVLLVLDSVTRYAMALRELGLAAGEPPALRAYTPNVFTALARMVERCGGLRSGGAITALMTILCETDDGDDPIAEAMKSLLDGHLVLSRALAERGQLPAIDVLQSLSRLASAFMDAPHARSRTSALQLLSVYDEAKIMIESGIYKTGASTDLDEAIRLRPEILSFLNQRSDENAALEQTIADLKQLSMRRRAHA